MGYAYNAPLHRFAVFTAACTLLLVVAGALVTSNDAGLAVPDWPLSYGSLMPPMVGGIFYEHGHRMVATFVGILTVVLAVWLQLREPRRWMRRLGWVALAAVIAQGLLGGLTVLFFLPRPVSISHASLAQLFFCTTVAIALFTSRWWMGEVEQRKGPAADDLRRFALALAAVVFFQLVLGASFRHRAIGIMPHIIWAFVVLGFSIALSRKVRLGFADVSALRKVAGLVSALVGTQILLGFAAWWSRLVAAEFPQPIALMVGFTVTHVAVGAATLGAAVLAALCCFRVLPPAATGEQTLRAADAPLRVNRSEL
jgi:cytochrome c oxidase assembly protein subunit 15